MVLRLLLLDDLLDGSTKRQLITVAVRPNELLQVLARHAAHPRGLTGHWISQVASRVAGAVGGSR
jgi:hypothetical protein